MVTKATKIYFREGYKLIINNFRTNFQGRQEHQSKLKEWKNDIFGKEFFRVKTKFLGNTRLLKTILVKGRL